MQEIFQSEELKPDELKYEALELKSLNQEGFFIDSHIHLWFERYDGFSETKTGFDAYQYIKNELIKFKSGGGVCVIDCTPYGLGREGNILRQLSLDSKINIITVTGFHNQLYYSHDFFLWSSSIREAENFFSAEIEENLFECRTSNRSIKAGIIKIPFLGKLEGQYLKLAIAAVNTSLKTGAPMLVHTDQGINVERIVEFLEGSGLDPKKVILHHMDKRPDIILHTELARKGYLLEYDTFLRPKYEPDKNLWLLIIKMIQAGYEDSIFTGSDIYENEMWDNVSKNGGLPAFFDAITIRLKQSGISSEVIKKIVGGNMAIFLSNNNLNYKAEGEKS